MMMEVKIHNKVQNILRNFNGDRMNTILVHTGTGHVLHVTKEFRFTSWHRPVVSIGIAEESSPEKVTKASIDSREKLEMLIKVLENHRNAFDE